YLNSITDQKFLKPKMPRKDAKKKKLERILGSPNSTSKEIQDAFTDYWSSTREFHECRYLRKETSESEYNVTIQILDSLNVRMKNMIIQIERLKNKNHILEKKNNNLQTENEKLRTENKELENNNENLQYALFEVATLANNSEEKNIQLRQAIKDIFDLCQNDKLKLNKLNRILYNNGVREIIIPRARYSGFNSAAEASKPKIYEINNDGSFPQPQLTYTYSFCETNEVDRANDANEAANESQIYYETNEDDQTSEDNENYNILVKNENNFGEASKV
ncbi:11164_t:CDS:2, partial [Racocetra fulgida]